MRNGLWVDHIYPPKAQLPFKRGEIIHMQHFIPKVTKQFIIGVAIALALFHLYTAFFGSFPGQIQRSIHWMGISVVIFLIKIVANYENQKRISILRLVLNYILVLAAVLTGVYLIVNYEAILSRIGNYTTLDLILGVVAVLLLLEATRRTLGWVLPTITLLFVVYAFAGPWIPGLLGHNGINFERFFTTMYLSTNGIYGMALGVAATFIFLFILFGSFLDRAGAGTFFVNLVTSITGKYTGGPALAAVGSSALMGTISGSGVANVVTTGNFTIPLMKRTGYKPHFAGAVEAVASNGGQIMPPIMGAAVFLMAELLGMPYIEIAIAALIPALLYFIAIAFVVYMEAKKENIRTLTKEELPSFTQTFKKGFVYLIPLVVIVWMLLKGFSPMKAAFYAIIAIVLIGVLSRNVKFNTPVIIDSMYGAVRSSLPVTAACACAGIIIGVVSLSGLGLKMSSLIVSLSNDIVWVALLLTMVVSIILGMGLPTSAAYLILAVLGGPALINMGVSPLSAHLFILYFGCLSTITPPVALSSFAAAGIAGSPPIRTGVESFRLAIVAFIIPYMFVFDSVLLMDGSWNEILLSFVSAVFGCFLIAASIIGWLAGRVNLIFRAILFATSLLLLHPSLYTDLIGVVIFGLTFLVIRYIHKRSNSEQPLKSEITNH